MKSEKKNKKLNKGEIIEADIIDEKESKQDKKAKKIEKKDKKIKKSKKKRSKGDGFFKEVIKELKRVKWPDKKYMAKYATATFVTIIVSSLYFYAIFALFSYIKELI